LRHAPGRGCGFCWSDPCGYTRATPPGLADQLIAEMRASAHRSGLALADTYIEHPGASSREGAAFRALVGAAPPHIHAVVIPSPEHFSRFGLCRATRTLIETETGAHVLVISNRSGGAR
jgi:hypothetical protein